jgi:hypothetical protein
MKRTFVPIVFLLLFCAGLPSPREQLLTDGVHNIHDYEFDPNSDITKRIVAVPDSVLSFLRALDGRDDYKTYMPTGEELDMFRMYFALLPSKNRQAVRESTVGIYFVSSFNGAGLSDFILGKRDDLYTMLVINPEVFHKTLSEWISLRENGLFIKTGNDISVRVDCGKKYKALMYVLIHETSHIVDYRFGKTPFVEPALKEIIGERKDGYKFTAMVWDDYTKSISRYTIRDAGSLSAYGIGGEKVPDTEMARMYRDMSATPFVSLYGSRNWAEDYADSVSFYFITQTLKQPYMIEVFARAKKMYSIYPEKNGLVRDRWRFFEDQKPR